MKGTSDVHPTGSSLQHVFPTAVRRLGVKVCWTALTLSELKHVNIVRLHDVIHTESKLVLIFEVSYIMLTTLIQLTGSSVSKI